MIGELVPKQIALRAAEPIALVVARADGDAGAGHRAVRLAARPLVAACCCGCWACASRASTEVTAEELHMIFAEATRSGVIEEEERAIMTGIMRLADRPVRELMTPRTELDWIDRRASEAELRASDQGQPAFAAAGRRWLARQHRRRGQGARCAGACCSRARKLNIARLMKKAEVIPDQLDAMDALRMLQQSDVVDGAWSTTNTAISKAWSPRPTCSPPSPAISPATRTRATSRWWSSARTARC